MPSIISVIGYGNVGQAVVSFLIANTAKNFIINVVDPDEQTYGAFLDHSHAAAVNGNHVMMYNHTSALSVSDYIIYTAGTNSKRGASRLSVANKNIAFTHQLFEGIQFKKEPFVIVIPNPVDVIAFHTWKATGFNPEKIIGVGTMLDAARLKYYLAKHFNSLEYNIETNIIGEHGDGLVPLFQRTTINGVKCDNFLTEEEKESIIAEVKGAATHIRKTQPATKYGVAKCACDILYALAGDQPRQFQASVKPDQFFAQQIGESELFISLPVIVGNQKISINHQVGIGKEELAKLQTAAKNLMPFVHGHPVHD